MIITLSLGSLMPPGFLERLPAEAIVPALANIAESARDKWVRLAGAGLHRTKRDYINGIQPIDFAHGAAVITLLGALPNAIEHGQPAMDMHDTLLGPNVPEAPIGQKGKHKKADGSGYYRAIPFRHATPGTGGAVGAPMGSAYAGHPELAAKRLFRASGYNSLGAYVKTSQELGKRVYGQAKKLKPTRGAPGGPVQYGQRLPAGLAPKLKEHHATDIYAGMVKSQKKYLRADQSQYTTFRTISTGSPGWKREATEGKHYARQAQEHAARIAPKAIAAYLAELLK